MSPSDHEKRARLIRRVSSTGDLEKTMRKATGVLAEFGIPSLVVGGYAVQENGYPRFTANVDIIVPDVSAARSRLSMHGFRENPGSSMTVTERATKVEVDLMPGGGKVGPGPLPLPMPKIVSKTPNVADLPTLLAIKLSSYMGSGISRLKDLADVTELIKANQMPRDLILPHEVSNLYRDTWDGIYQEGEPDPRIASRVGVPA